MLLSLPSSGYCPLASEESTAGQAGRTDWSSEAGAGGAGLSGLLPGQAGAADSVFVAYLCADVLRHLSETTHSAQTMAGSGAGLFRAAQGHWFYTAGGLCHVLLGGLHPDSLFCRAGLAGAGAACAGLWPVHDSRRLQYGFAHLYDNVGGGAHRRTHECTNGADWPSFGSVSGELVSGGTDYAHAIAGYGLCT
uniref:Uncharacterized protein n=1 Tax=Panagrolaimus superbus TaxID=310955 RepID=A0A914YLE8_9BILA